VRHPHVGRVRDQGTRHWSRQQTVDIRKNKAGSLDVHRDPIDADGIGGVGVDPEFGAHSVRSAVTSATCSADVSLKDIMQTTTVASHQG
jgi:hypothetical protein